jgi:hypothetical protein
LCAAAPPIAHHPTNSADAGDGVADLVKVRLSLFPADARATLDGEVIDGPVLTRPRSDVEHALRISAEGYAPITRTLTFTENQTLEIGLERRRPPPTRARSPREDQAPRGDQRIIRESPYGD